MAAHRDIDGARCAQLRREGWSLRLIARKLGVGQTTVRYHTQGIVPVEGVKARTVASQRYGAVPEPLLPSADLAYLLGVICGDGSLSPMPRTYKLGISCDARYPELIERYCDLIARLTGKKVAVCSRKNGNYFEICAYGKFLPLLLGLPGGAKKADYPVPQWVFFDLDFVRPFLRGLIETDGGVYHEFRNGGWASRCIFTNLNPSIMDAFFHAASLLGYEFRRCGKDARLTRTAQVKQLVAELDLKKQRVYIQKGSSVPPDAF